MSPDPSKPAEVTEPNFDRTTAEGLFAATVENLRREAVEKRRFADSLDAEAVKWQERADRLMQEAAAAEQVVALLALADLRAARAEAGAS